MCRPHIVCFPIYYNAVDTLTNNSIAEGTEFFFACLVTV